MGKSFDDIINDSNGEKYVKWLIGSVKSLKDTEYFKLIDYYKKVKNI